MCGLNMIDKSVLVTGSSGFIGAALLKALDERYVDARGISRSAGSRAKDFVGDFSSDEFIIPNNPNCVVHLAALTPACSRCGPDEYQRINVDATLRLAKQAEALGVKRFIFISSVKVNGEETTGESAFSTDSPYNPQSDYGASKAKAEEALLEFAGNSLMEIVIIRPPLVYGPGVKGNLYRLSWLIDCKVPLPFKAVNNAFSMVSLSDLVNFICHCIEHPAAANEIFLISDGRDWSSAALLDAIGRATNRKVRLFSVKKEILQLFFRAIGAGALSRALLRSLRVDISKTEKLLGWKPTSNIELEFAKSFR